MSPDEAVGALLISIASGVVLGIATLMIIYRMVDGHVPVGAGIISLILIVLCMALAIHPPHPMVPGAVLVSALALMAFFPFAEQKLEEFEMRRVDATRLAKSYKAVELRPDNFAAKFELAQILHDHGFPSHAIALASAALASLSEERDDVKNRSVRDLFHREELLLNRWMREPHSAKPIACLSCGRQNEVHALFCAGCGRPYLLDIVQGQEIKPRVWAKLVIAWAALALFIPAAVAIGMQLDGIIRIASFVGALLAVGGLLAWMFRPPKHHVAAWSLD